MLLVHTAHVAAQVLLLGTHKGAQSALVLRWFVQRDMVVHLRFTLRDVRTDGTLLLLALCVVAGQILSCIAAAAVAVAGG